jgi:hypothetical protein
MMPVAEIPAALERVLGTLLVDNTITSWKVAAEGSNTTLVVRLVTAGPDQHGASCQQSSQHATYRKKPPSQIRRDQQRAYARLQAKNNELRQASDISFPNPPISNIAPKVVSESVQSELGLFDNSDTVYSNIPEGDPCAREVRELTTLQPSLSRESPRDLLTYQRDDVTAVPHTNSDKQQQHVLEKKTGFPMAVVHNYVSALKDRSLVRRVRDQRRNQYFRTVVTHPELPDRVICESDDMVTVYTCVEPLHTAFFCLKQDDRHMMEEERGYLRKLRTGQPVDRGRYDHYVQCARADMCMLMEMIRWCVG